jgi:aspartokinase-like uncharacterized kinase
LAEVIIKAGGSLQKGSNLADLCLALGSIGKKQRIIIIPGGGIFADSVRNCTRDFNINQDISHWMAILAMNQYGYLLASLIPGSICMEDIEEAKNCADNYQPVVFLPYRLINAEDPLPHSWDATSDSIAAWIAGYVDSKRLILLKSKNLYQTDKPDQDYKNPVDLDYLKKTDLVDPMFYSVMKKLSLDLWIINGNFTEQLIGLLG